MRLTKDRVKANELDMYYTFPPDLIFIFLFFGKKDQQDHHGLELDLSLDVWVIVYTTKASVNTYATPSNF